MIRPKLLKDADLYELLFQSGIAEPNIPKSRKARIKLFKQLPKGVNHVTTFK